MGRSPTYHALWMKCQLPKSRAYDTTLLLELAYSIANTSNQRNCLTGKSSDLRHEGVSSPAE